MVLVERAMYLSRRMIPLRFFTTWFEYSSPKICPPVMATSFFRPGTNARFSECVFERDDRSLIGAKMLRREPDDLRRNLTWLEAN